MPEVGIKQLKAEASAIIDAVQAGTPYVVTKRGKPAAVILSIEEAEDVVLANAEEYVELVRQGRADHATGSTVSLDEV